MEMWKRIVILVSISAMLGMLLCGCKSDEDKIRERVEMVVFSFNSGDAEGFLDCYDAKTRNVNKAVLGIGDSLLGMGGINIGLSSLFALTVGLQSNGDLVRVEDIQITMNADRTRATVNATLYYENADGGYDSPLQISMIKENGDWFITP